MENIANFSTLDHWVVYGFLIFIATVGWYVGRKNKNITEYAIANKMFGTLILTITLLATYVGGAMTVGYTTNVFADGIIVAMVALGSFIPLLFTALCIAPRVDHLNGCLTMGDIMGRFYGEQGKTTIGVIGTLYSLLIVGNQAVAMGHVSHALLGIKANTGTIISGAIMVFYSFHGGVKSVTITDVLQFAALIFMIPLIAFVATDHAGGIREVINKVPAEKLIVFRHEKFYYYLVAFTIWSIFPTFVLNPPMIQRVLMGQDKQQVKKVFLIGAVFVPFFTIMITFIGLSALVSAPNIKSSLALPYLVNELFPMGIKGLVVVGLLAVAMSTGDSFLNAGGLLLSHDVVKPMYDRKKKEINEVKLTKYITLVMGVVGIFVGLLCQDVVKISFWAASLFSSTITIPLIAGILGLKTDIKSFFTALWTSVTTFIIASLYLKSDQAYLATLLSILANGVSFFCAHLAQHNGLVIVKRRGNCLLDEKVSWESIVTNCKNSLPPISSITSFSKRQVERYGTNHLLFAVFFCLNYIVPYFMWTHEKSLHFATIMSLRVIGGILCVGLLTEDFWPKWAKNCFPTYWHFSVLYCLPFMSTVMLFLMGGEGMEWIINLSLAIVVAASLVDWISFILLMVGGVAAGYGFFTVFSHKYLGGITPLSTMSSTYLFLLVYGSVFATLIGLVFFRKKEKETRRQLKSMETFAGALMHEVSNVVGVGQMYASALLSFIKGVEGQDKKKEQLLLDKNVYSEIKEMVEMLERDSSRGITIMNRLLVTLKPEIKPDDIDVYSISECVREAMEGYGLEEFQEECIRIDIKKDFKFRGSKYYVIHVLYQLLKNVHKHAGVDCKIEIWTEGNKLHFKDNGPGIARKRLSHIFEYFYSIDKSGTGVGLAFCKAVMDELKGSIACETEEGRYTEFILTFRKENTAQLHKNANKKEKEG